MASHLWFIAFVVLTLCVRTVLAIRCPMRVVMIKNGDYNLRNSNTMVSFTCNSGFTLYGSPRIVCFGDTWSGDPPICIANTCQVIRGGPAMKIEKQYDGALLKFSCTVGHKLEGAGTLICDGKAWSDSAPQCKAWEPPRSCDFEAADLCGWSHHDEVDQQWRWHTGATKTTRTGPDHDHTFNGGAGMGHYMYFETSSPTRTGHQAWLSSPLYPDTYSEDSCFEFWYHSLGTGAMGWLEVFMKPEVANLSDSERMFFLNRSVGNQWQREMIPIARQQHVFQIVFLATRGSGYRSDFGIDDVSLKPCSDFTSPEPVRTTPPTTIKSTTKATTITTTSAPVTTIRTTLKTTPQPSTKRPTTRPSTTRSTVTTKPTVKQTTIPTRQTTKTNKTVKATTPTKATTATESKSTQTNTRLSTVRSTPSTGNQKQEHHTSQALCRNSGAVSTGTKVAYIFVGVGICLCIAVVLGVAFFIYKRNMKQIYYTKDSSSVGVDNLLYSVGSNDETAVQFN